MYEPVIVTLRSIPLGIATSALSVTSFAAAIVNRFSKRRFLLIAVMTFACMFLSSTAGILEESLTLVPIAVAISLAMGWDSLTGIGMSFVAVAFGFTAATFNPFNVITVQKLAGLQVLSGMWLRLIIFVAVYTTLTGFLIYYAKKIEKPLSETAAADDFTPDHKLSRALLTFAVIVGIGIVFILCSTFIKALQDYTMIAVALMFLIAGIVSPVLTGMKPGELIKHFGKGVTSIFPAVIMILMAASIRFTLEEAKILDTLLHGAVGIADGLPKWAVILFIYLIVLGMNFFIGSGSAKAFMLIPLIVPLAQIFGISSQLCIVLCILAIPK